MTQEQTKQFEELSRPLMKWLCENFHPHVVVIIEPTSASMHEGLCSTGQIIDYLKD